MMAVVRKDVQVFSRCAIHENCEYELRPASVLPQKKTCRRLAKHKRRSEDHALMAEASSPRLGCHSSFSCASLTADRFILCSAFMFR